MISCCAESSGSSFDDFKVQDYVGPFEVDGRYFCDKGNARVDYGNNNVLELHDEGGKRCVIRRGFQGSYYEATFKFKWDTATGPGWVVRWRDPGNWLAIGLTAGPMQKAWTRLYRRKGDGLVTNLATGSISSLTSGSTYEAKVVVDEDPNNPNTQRLRFYIDADGDGDYSDETILLNSSAVDDTWSAGYVGLYRAARYPVTCTSRWRDEPRRR